MTKKVPTLLIWLGVGVGLVLLCPFPSTIAQPLQIEFSGEEARSVSGMRVSESWESYGLFGSGRDTQIVGASGSVKFPARYAYGTVATRLLARAFTVVSVHSSYGGRVVLEFTLPPTVEVVFAEPPFNPLQKLATSGNYRGADMRYYYWELSPNGQRIMVSGEFATGAPRLHFQLRKMKTGS